MTSGFSHRDWLKYATSSPEIDFTKSPLSHSFALVRKTNESAVTNSALPNAACISLAQSASVQDFPSGSGNVAIRFQDSANCWSIPRLDDCCQDGNGVNANWLSRRRAPMPGRESLMT